MGHLPARGSLLTNEGASRPEGLPMGSIGLSTEAMEGRSIASEPKAVRTFEERLEAAEQEARAIHERWKAIQEAHSSKPTLTLVTQMHVKPVDGLARASQVQYNHDIESADEEILSNLEEVQQFNRALEIAQEEARSINQRWGSSEEVLLTSPFDTQDLDLVTSIMEVVREPLLILDNALCVKKANRAFYRTFSHIEEDTETRFIYDLAHGAWNIPVLKELLAKVLLTHRAYEELEIESEFPLAGRKTLRLNVRRLSGGEMILMSIRDVTPRRRTEVELRRVQDELRQGQKMEVIGRLAGGVAHDFNNILTGILGFSEILMGSLEKGSDSFRQAMEIKKASERAAALTQQLLAFSRRQVLRPQVVCLNTVILELKEMLCRLIGDNIELNHVFDEDLGAMLADPGQLGQIILNLALNARDAMPEGGTLSIRTENTGVSEGGRRIRGLAAGSYVSLTVTDTGTGMDLETQQHIFEPFYTTKPQGSGTGLGLATVFGIVEQSGGTIRFFSEVDSGTTFWIDFPRVEGTTSVEAPRERTEMLRGTETVLVVEDDDLVRDLVVLILERQGYTVLEATQASQGLALCRLYPNQIDLMITDLLMPGGMDGRQLVEQASKIRGGMKVLLMSGYTTDALVLYGVGDGAAPFLQKPFTQQQLAGKIRDVLDGGLSSALVN
ncbi:ATP-binding protein [Granulicella sp. dw_53]|uniref:ATP-binding protein n=1 Tax=Granulicella sp. dw_53 TaxID=2719792 RepID=UPI001BD364DD|nr:ATP-binding protein [Granulicella sp. dw_53]